MQWPCAQAMNARLVNSGPLSVRTACGTAETSHFVEQASDVLAGDAEVDTDLHALVAEVIGDGETLDSMPVGQAVAHEIHAPYLVDGAGQLQWHAL